jgi:uncharacterized Zn finger protein (UPF0148 family)
MQCETCGKPLIHDMIDEEVYVYCPCCGKEYNEDDEANIEANIS